LTNQPELMTLEEAATYLRVNRMTVYRLMRQHTLPGVKVGRQWRIRRADLDVYIRGTAQPQLGVRRKQEQD
jgi:excisionase family DNA binding protein